MKTSGFYKNLIWIINAKYISNYSIELEFNDNKKGTVD